MRSNHPPLLTSRDRAHDKEWLGAFCDCVGQRVIGRIVGHVFAANKESHHWPALLCRVITDCPTQHRIFFFECVENCPLRDLAVEIDMYFIADACQRAQMMREYDADHGKDLVS